MYCVMSTPRVFFLGPWQSISHSGVLRSIAGRSIDRPGHLLGFDRRRARWGYRGESHLDCSALASVCLVNGVRRRFGRSDDGD